MESTLTTIVDTTPSSSPPIDSLPQQQHRRLQRQRIVQQQQQQSLQRLRQNDTATSSNPINTASTTMTATNNIMLCSKEPRPIRGTAGSHIQCIQLGETGSDYFISMQVDDGQTIRSKHAWYGSWPHLRLQQLQQQQQQEQQQQQREQQQQLDAPSTSFLHHPAATSSPCCEHEGFLETFLQDPTYPSTETVVATATDISTTTTTTNPVDHVPTSPSSSWSTSHVKDPNMYSNLVFAASAPEMAYMIQNSITNQCRWLSMDPVIATAIQQRIDFAARYSTTLQFHVSWGKYSSNCVVWVQTKCGISSQRRVPTLWISPAIESNLRETLQELQRSGTKSIHVLRIFHGDYWFISDDDGYKWNLPPNVTGLVEEILENQQNHIGLAPSVNGTKYDNLLTSSCSRTRGQPPILDVALAVDGSWVVLRDNIFTVRFVHEGLRHKLHQFYDIHQSRQEKRMHEIQHFRRQQLQQQQQQRRRRQQQQQSCRQRPQLHQEEEEELEACTLSMNTALLVPRGQRKRVAETTTSPSKRGKEEHAPIPNEANRRSKRPCLDFPGESSRQLGAVPLGGELDHVQTIQQEENNVIHLDDQHVNPLVIEIDDDSDYDNDDIVNECRCSPFSNGLEPVEGTAPDAADQEDEGDAKPKAVDMTTHCVSDGSENVLDQDMDHEPDPIRSPEVIQIDDDDDSNHSTHYDPCWPIFKFDDSEVDEPKLPAANPAAGSLLSMASTALVVRPVFDNDESTGHALVPRTLQDQHQLIIPTPILEKVQAFDEHTCIEKINIRKLQAIRSDLDSDRRERTSMLKMLEYKRFLTVPEEHALKCLRRCEQMDMFILDMDWTLQREPVDDKGNVYYRVIYENKDETCRGRLFATRTGPVRRYHSRPSNMQSVANQKEMVRSLTLQGMHKDLRLALVGSFGHDIDCENSVVRLLCSLASQFDVEHLVPTLIRYRDNRQEYIDIITRFHGISVEQAKSLPHIIVSGGQYSTWLEKVGLSAKPGRRIRSIVEQWQRELGAVRDVILRHPKFRWIQLDIERMQRKGRREESIDSSLLPRILMACEDEVLSILHRFFFDCRWTVRAKIFDGLLVEPQVPVAAAPSLRLRELLDRAQQLCLSRGWDVRLKEKELHGHQDEPVATLVDARYWMHQVLATIPTTTPTTMTPTMTMLLDGTTAVTHHRHQGTTYPVAARGGAWQFDLQLLPNRYSL